jgi:hypothetical protein
MLVTINEITASNCRDDFKDELKVTVRAIDKCMRADIIMSTKVQILTSPVFQSDDIKATMVKSASTPKTLLKVGLGISLLGLRERMLMMGVPALPALVNIKDLAKSIMLRLQSVEPARIMNLT